MARMKTPPPEKDADSHPRRVADIRDVAAAAGVSTATVSRAMRGVPRVSAATRQRVLAAAASLDYVASSAASNLARGRGKQREPSPAQSIIQADAGAGDSAQSAPVGQAGSPKETAAAGHAPLLLLIGPPAGARDAAVPALTEQANLSLCAERHGFRLQYVQPEQDAEMISAIRAATGSVVGVIISVGGLECATKAPYDALAHMRLPVVGVQLNNPYRLDGPIHPSPLSSLCSAVIIGAGVHGYKLAFDYLAALLQAPGAEHILLAGQESRALSGLDHP